MLLAACGNDDDSAETTETTTAEAVTTTASTAPITDQTTAPPTTAPTATTAPAETTEPEAGGVDGLPPDTEGWATEMVIGWGRGDRDRVARLATPEVVDALFAYADPGGPDWELERCEGAAGSTYCTFTDEYRMTSVVTHQANMPDEQTGALPPIDEATFRPRQLDEEALGVAADPLIQAWGAGDREEAGSFALPEVVDQLFAIADPGGTDWDRRDCLYVDDDAQCIYFSPSRDERVIVHFDASALPGDLVISGVEQRDGASG